MRGALKTLFGDTRNLCTAALCVLAALALLHTPAAALAGAALPIALLAGAAYLAKH